MQGITEWIAGWKAPRLADPADRKPVKNEDLWRRLDEARLRHEVKWFWVKGHAGDEMNERADRLANRAIDEMLGDVNQSSRCVPHPRDGGQHARERRPEEAKMFAAPRREGMSGGCVKATRSSGAISL